jgi:16S rRNA (guanine527-N7)-methyltransferase
MGERYDPPAEFLQACEASGIELTDAERDALGRYLWLLLDANTRFNLTAIRDPDEAWTRHVFDSLTLLPHIMESDGRSVIDVGSGGGLPGIPLAICQPQMQFTLMDATGKKARFLEEVVADLSLDQVRVVNDRAETAGQTKAHRERYDIATARAVGPMRVMLEYTMPLVRVGGRVLAMKGRQAEVELGEAGDALMILGDGRSKSTTRSAMSRAMRSSWWSPSMAPRRRPTRAGPVSRRPIRCDRPLECRHGKVDSQNVGRERPVPLRGSGEDGRRFAQPAPVLPLHAGGRALG